MSLKDCFPGKIRDTKRNLMDSKSTISRSELIERIADRQDRLQHEDIKLAVQSSFDYLSQALSLGDRIEIRGFGSFSLHFRKPKTMRNPKTKEIINVSGRNIPHFKPGNIVNQRLNKTYPSDTTTSDYDINKD